MWLTVYSMQHEMLKYFVDTGFHFIIFFIIENSYKWYMVDVFRLLFALYTRTHINFHLSE